MNKIKLNLYIFDFEIPFEEISKIIGIEPTSIRIKGEARTKNNILKIEENCWVLSSGLDEDQDFEAHLNAIIEIIKQNLKGFKTVCKEYYTELSCIVKISENEEISTPSIHLTKDAIGILAQINASIDYDIYLID